MWENKRTGAHDAHGDDCCHRDGVSRIFGLLAGSGDAVEADVRVETSGRSGDHSGLAERKETVRALPVVAAPVVVTDADDDGHHAQIDQRQKAIHVGRGLHAHAYARKTNRPVSR